MELHTRFKIAGFLFCISFGSAANAQQYAELFAGTKTPYTQLQQNYTAVPQGFSPYFVNYVGRHGARFLTKSGADKEALEILEQAEKDHGLSDTGRMIKNSVQKLLLIQQGGYEKITELGALEQKQIGERLFSNYKSAFTGKGVLVQYTFKVRTKQSADAFLIAYRNYTGRITVDKNTSAANSMLRFYDLSPAYDQFKQGVDIHRSLDSLDADSKEINTVKDVCRKLFTPGYAEKLIGEKKSGAFVQNLYDLYAASFAVSVEQEKKGYTADSINLKLAFSEENLKWMDFKAGASDFLEKGPGRDSVGIQVKIAAPLLADILKTTGNATSGKKEDGRFRFTHAEAISPLAALLGISTASRPVASVFQYADIWKTDQIIPLSANIQWILYSNGKRFLVKILLNEREVKIPIASSTAPYYDWSAVRTYYLEKLKTIDFLPGMNDLTYLTTVKP